MKKILILCVVIFLAGCNLVNNVQEPNKSPSSPTKQDEQSRNEMKVHFLNVGQGDSILIETPNGKTMLIDGGVKSEGKHIVAYIKSLGIEKLNYVVATHPDADHIGGLIAVLNSISIQHFVDSGKVHTSQTYENIVQLIVEKNIEYIVPQTGDQLNVDKAITVEVLHADETATDNNEASIVLKVNYGEVSFLLTGDAGIRVEEKMMANSNVAATILKAGHHGSNTSSSKAFIEAVQPEVAILSYGQDNSYGHPHYEVTSSLQQLGTKLYGTAESDHIIIETDGVSYEVDANEWTGIGATSSITPKPKSGKLEIIYKNNVDEIVTIQNNSDETISLKDWILVSVAGNQQFKLPNISLQSGKKISIVSGPDAMSGQGKIQWTKRAIWLNNESDKAELRNPKGEVVSEYE